jgi:hypothetical protein
LLRAKLKNFAIHGLRRAQIRCKTGPPSPWLRRMLLVLTRLKEPSSEAILAPNSTAALPAHLMPHPRAHEREAHRFMRRERETAPAKLEPNLALSRARMRPLVQELAAIQLNYSAIGCGFRLSPQFRHPAFSPPTPRYRRSGKPHAPAQRPTRSARRGMTPTESILG